ncbi:MAG: glycosyltransferase family 87 protein [Nitriliruptor sp.]
MRGGTSRPRATPGRRQQQRTAAAPYLAIVGLGAVLLPGYHQHLTPDGISYLSVAEHYAAGRLTEAVNGYWSPLFSWAMTPLIAVGVPSTLAAKIVTLLAALGVLWAIRRSTRTIGVSEPTVTLVSWAMVLPLIASAYAFITPDLIVALPVLLYVERLARPAGADAIASGAWAGVWAGLAYLTKLFALPFVLVHLLVAAGLTVRRRGTAATIRTAGVALVVFGVIVGGWSAALTVKYGYVTAGTAASTNIDYLTPGSPGNASQWAGPLPPPHEHAVSAWEDLPLAADRAEVSVAPGEERDDAPGPSLIGRAFDQMDDLVGAAFGWAPVVVLALAAPFLLRLKRPGRRGERHPIAEDPTPALLFAAGAAVWAGGVLATYAQARYLWAALLLLTPLAGAAIDALRVARPRDLWWQVAAAVLIVGMVPGAIEQLRSDWGVSDDVVEVAGEVESQVDLRDTRVASTSDWAAMLGFCHHLGCRYHGIPGPSETGDELAADLEEQDIEYLVVRGAVPADVPVGDQVASFSGGALTIYELD